MKITINFYILRHTTPHVSCEIYHPPSLTIVLSEIKAFESVLRLQISFQKIYHQCIAFPRYMLIYVVIKVAFLCEHTWYSVSEIYHPHVSRETWGVVYLRDTISCMFTQKRYFYYYKNQHIALEICKLVVHLFKCYLQA